MEIQLLIITVHIHTGGRTPTLTQQASATATLDDGNIQFCSMVFFSFWFTFPHIEFNQRFIAKTNTATRNHIHSNELAVKSTWKKSTNES